MWISTAERLPKPGQKVFFTTGPIIYRGSFQLWHVRQCGDGQGWLSISGLRVTHWIPAGEDGGAGAACVILSEPRPYRRLLQHFARPLPRLTHILKEA